METHRIKIDVAADKERPQFSAPLWRASAVALELGCFASGAVLDLEGVSSVTLRVRRARMAEAVMLEKTVAAAAFTACTAPQWAAGTHEHVRMEFSSNDMNITVGARVAVLHVTLSAVLASGGARVLGVGEIILHDANAVPGEVTEPPGTAVTLEECDARFVRFDGEQGLTEGAQAQVRANLGLGASTPSDHGGLTGLGDDDHPQYLNNARGDARYLPLAVIEQVPAAAQESTVDFTGVTPGGLQSNYIDIPFDAAGHVHRFWFNVTSEGVEPATPPDGRISQIALTGDETEPDLASALASAVDADADISCVASGQVATVTQPPGDLSALVNTTPANITEVAAGAAAYQRLAVLSGEQLVKVDALTLGGYSPGDFAVAAHIHNFLTDLSRRPSSVALASDFVRNANTLASVTGMSLPVVAGVSYKFEVDGFYATSGTTEGLGVALLGPSATGINIESTICLAATGTLNLARNSAWDAVHQGPSSAGNVNHWFRLRGRFTATAAGTLELRAQAETGGANSITIRAGTTMDLTPLG